MMAYSCNPMSIRVRQSGYSVYVCCEYETIHIKWDTGFMDICPPMLFTDADLTKIRKVFRMAIMSDIEHKTNTISAWRKAFKAERDYQFKVFSAIADEYNAGYTDLVDGAGKQDPKRGKKLSELQKRKTRAIRLLDARKKKVQECAEIFENMVTKYT